MKTKLLIAAVVFSFCFTTNIFAQLNLLWNATYNGPNNRADAAYGMCVDNSGNVYVTGESDGSYHGQYSGFVATTVKYNSAGVQQWTADYSVPGENTQAMNIAVDNSGNVYIVGFTNGVGKIFFVKYNSSGVEQWVKTNTNWGGFESICLDPDGNIYVGGSTKEFSSGEMLLAKFSPDGTLQWSRGYHHSSVTGSGQGRVKQIAYNSGYIYEFGDCKVNSTNAHTLLKYDLSGNLQWASSHQPDSSGYSAFEDWGLRMGFDNAGNIYALGKLVYPSSVYKFLTLKYSPAGVEQWAANFTEYYNHTYPYSIAVSGNGDCYVTGVSGAAAVTIKYNTNGVQQWLTKEPGTANIGSTATVDSDGDLFIGMFGNGLVYYNNNTGVKITTSPTVTGYMAVSNNGYIYMTGGGPFTTGNSQNYFTSKVQKITSGIINPGGNVPAAYRLSQNYPNPFNPSTKIKFDIPQHNTGVVSLKVYDELGKEVYALVNRSMAPGSYETTFDGANLNSGVYYYSLEAGDFKESKKMLLIK